MTKEQIEKAAEEYAGLTDNPKDPNVREKGARCIAFKDGANWRINSVWHDAGEKPVFDDTGKYEKFLVLYKDSGSGLIISNGEDDWNDILSLTKFVKWAYVSDLVPEIKEERE